MDTGKEIIPSSRRRRSAPGKSGGKLELKNYFTLRCVFLIFSIWEIRFFFFRSHHIIFISTGDWPGGLVACPSRWWSQLIRIIKTFQISEELITRGSLITLCMSTLFLRHVTTTGSRWWGRGWWDSQTISKRLRHGRNMSHLHPQYYNAGVPLDIFFWVL